jgi:hypothetical protein
MLFCSPDVFWIGRRSRIFYNAIDSAERLFRGKEPAFEFPMGQDYRHWHLCRFLCSVQKLNAKLRGAIIVRIDQHHDSAYLSPIPYRLTDSSFQFTGFDDTVPLDPKWAGNLNVRNSQLSKNASQKDRD